MILDTLDSARRYAGILPGLADGFAWLARLPERLEPGRVAINGDAVFALIQEYDTGPASEKRLESHRKHIDIQYMVSGQEIIQVASIGGLQASTEYDADKDIRFYEDPPALASLVCAPGTFTVFFPEDGHKPGCLISGPSRVRKIVVKVRI